MNDQLATLDHVKRTIIDLAILFGPRVLVAIAIIVAGVFIGRWASRGVGKGLVKFHLEPPVRHLLERVVKVLVIGLFAIMALQNLGVELLPLIAGLGVASAGIALAMQGVLSNIMAGLTIIFTRPFRVGEYISIAAEEGQVEAITLSNTVLTHSDLSQIVIPNRKIVGEILHNYGKIRQIEVTVSVAYDTDLNNVLAVVGEVLQASPLTLKTPAPVIAVNVLGRSYIEIAARPWVNVPDYGPAGSEVKKAIVEAFRGKNIVGPLPRYEVQMLGNTA